MNFIFNRPLLQTAAGSDFGSVMRGCVGLSACPSFRIVSCTLILQVETEMFHNGPSIALLQF